MVGSHGVLIFMVNKLVAIGKKQLSIKYFFSTRKFYFFLFFITTEAVGTH